MTLDLETVFWLGAAFILGAAVGSFLNVCIWRLPRRQSPVAPPSHCPHCQHQLRLWPDMVPLLSQIVYRSRCRYCGARFSWRYFWVELVTGLLFAAVAFRFAGRPLELVPNMVFVAMLVAIAFIDYEHFEIPDGLVVVAIGVGVMKDVALMIRDPLHHPLWHTIPGTQVQLPVPVSVVGALVSGWFLWQLAAVASAAVRQEAMGGGDTFLLAAMGANLPFHLVGMAFFIAVGLGAVGGVCVLAVAEWRSSSGAEGPAPLVPVEEAEEVEEDGTPALRSGSVPLEPDPVFLPRDSRVGRVLTVLGTWAALLGVWWIVARWSEHQRSLAVSVGLLALTLAVALLRGGIRLWHQGDRVWAPQADAAFIEEGPAPHMIQFGPYLVLGTLIALFFGDDLIRAYLSWLGIAAGS
jgi:leader peptidase (prepilin peptidase)/N-methyltransferase